MIIKGNISSQGIGLGEESQESNAKGSSLNDLVEVMKDVKTDSSEAELNAVSISDGKRGRIELDEPKIIRKGTLFGNLRNKQF